MSVSVYSYKQAYTTAGGETRYKKITMTYKKRSTRYRKELSEEQILELKNKYFLGVSKTRLCLDYDMAISRVNYYLKSAA